MVKVIVGLGNPGTRYDGTRHNLGFAVVDRLGERWSIAMAREKFHAFFGDGSIEGEPVVLLKPTTFMNRSGQAVAAAVRFFRIEPDDLLVVSDDVALPLGRLRMRRKGSGGGHNGLNDVIERLGTDGFCRLRLGIGGPFGASPAYVLARFAASEVAEVERMVSQAADAVERWVVEGPEATMNRFNTTTEES